MTDTAERTRVDEFRYNGRTAVVLIAMLAALLLLLVLAALLGPGFDPESRDPLYAALGAAFLLGLIAIIAWAGWRRPVLLRVGPAGLDLPIGFRRPLPWSRIHRIRRFQQRRTLHRRMEWLRVDPSPGAMPDYRLPSPERLERWHLRRSGIRIPLSELDATPDEVVASIERYRPVSPAVD